MIEIRHKTTGEVLYRTEADTLKKVNFCKDSDGKFRDINLESADLRSLKLDGADFTLTPLSDADLTGASCIKAVFYSNHLRRADLSGARLWGIDGEGTDFRDDVLRGAQMYAAWLRHASLSRADLREAELKAVYLGCASLRHADLRGADLSEAILHGTDVKEARMAGAILDSTVFANCTNLHTVSGLDEIDHRGPSSLDHLTLRACAAHLSDRFLLGVGYSEEELRRLRVMYPEGIVPKRQGRWGV